ncbi:hypothetical protein AcW2_004771 [Taiwanofungus camphoratus]|nr:hypothetical protein AcW2_004771 [Antrodia cinnamomea]
MLWLLISGLLLAALSHAQVLVDFQVAQPPPLPQDAQQCTILILERTFGWSYGDPEIVQYTYVCISLGPNHSTDQLRPPTDCGPVGSWAGISLNFTVTSNGTQYDRLGEHASTELGIISEFIFRFFEGVFTFQNVEIWRTSTPEPTIDGIIWTYLKDVTRYIPLFSNPGTFILELDNLIETGLNGEYASTLHATFYASSAQHPAAPRTETIIPVTTLANNTGDEASVPPVFSLNVTVPQNAVQVYAELYASGSGDEEFWYFNTANEYLSDLPSGTTYGNGPFREVRMLVDGQLAGVAFPCVLCIHGQSPSRLRKARGSYAVIFTGGIIPSAWRPITSYGALDLPTYFIDLTPFVPVLTDGNPHNISIDVVSAETDHTINQNWYVSGNLQIVTDPSAKPTTGKITVYNAQPYAQTTTSGSVGDRDVNVTVSASRSIHIESEIRSGSGAYTYVVWTQNLEYSNTQYYLDNTYVQNVAQTATGSFLSTHNGIPSLTDQFSYPLNINLTVLNEEGTSIMASFDHSYERTSLPSPFILGSTIHERQLAIGYFEETPSGNYGNGTSNNTFSYVDLQGNSYDREVNASLDVITYDHQSGTLASGSPLQFPAINPLAALPMVKPRLPGGRQTGL